MQNRAVNAPITFEEIVMVMIISVIYAALQAATILVAMASEKNYLAPKILTKAWVGDRQIIKETYLENEPMFGRIIKSKSDDITYLSLSRRFVTWYECVILKWA